MRWNRHYVIYGLCVLLSALTIPTLAPADVAKETASEILMRLAKELETRGLDRIIGPRGAAAREGGISAVPVKLDEGRPYHLTVIGDDDARSLAVVVVERDSRRILLQEATDGRVVQGKLIAPFAGTYDVAVWMRQCNVQPCAYQVMLHAPPRTGIRAVKASVREFPK